VRDLTSSYSASRSPPLCCPNASRACRTFGGRPDDAAVKQHEESLYADLERNGVNLSQVDKKSMIFAQYQSPFKLFNRRNEIWVAAKSS